jgi:hypothetical protein
MVVKHLGLLAMRKIVVKELKSNKLEAACRIQLQKDLVNLNQKIKGERVDSS